MALGVGRIGASSVPAFHAIGRSDRIFDAAERIGGLHRFGNERMAIAVTGPMRVRPVNQRQIVTRETPSAFAIGWRQFSP